MHTIFRDFDFHLMLENSCFEFSYIFWSIYKSYWANSMFGCVISVDQNNFVAFCVVLIIEIEIMVCFDE